jgi:hypothetical protein
LARENDPVTTRPPAAPRRRPQTYSRPDIEILDRARFTSTVMLRVLF